MIPRISVLMPVWNGERYLAAAIDSILAQTFKDFELIVVDDGSTDHTVEILRSFSDPRLQIHHLDHGGIVMALNYGVEQARAIWIARQDADDISFPRRLEMQWNAINRHDSAVLCHTEAELNVMDGNIPDHARFPKTRAFTALRLCYQSPIIHSTVVFRKDAFLAAGGYRPDERHAEDFALWGRLLELGDFIGLRTPLVQFRLHAESVSKQNPETQIRLATRIGTDHCHRFMRLDEADAARANALLLTAPCNRAWRDWWWFLTRCTPRLRWKSAEAFAWLLWQTAKMCLPAFRLDRVVRDS